MYIHLRALWRLPFEKYIHARLVCLHVRLTAMNYFTVKSCLVSDVILMHLKTVNILDRQKKHCILLIRTNRDCLGGIEGTTHTMYGQSLLINLRVHGFSLELMLICVLLKKNSYRDRSYCLSLSG